MKWGYEFDENLILPRQHQTLKGKILRELGDFHKNVTLMKHFMLGAVSRYGYAKRTKGYMKRKAAKYHHQIPLVYSGVLKSVVRLIGIVRLLGKADGWKYHVRSYFPMTDERKNEIQIVTPDEIERHNRWLGRQYVARLPQYCRKRKKRSSP